jgi:hypothetical protein
MSEEYKNENITAYLLGTLPEAEAEHFDELSFTDDEFADTLKAAEKDLVDSYILGELRGDALKQFNSHYLDSPMRREKVEFARAFQLFAEKHFAQTARESPPVADSKPHFAGFISKFFTFSRPSLQWGLALAALAFMFFGGWMFVENSRLRSQMNEEQARREEILKRESDLQQREIQLQNQIANQRTTNAETAQELASIRAERTKLENELKNRQAQEQQRLAGQKQLNEQRSNEQRSNEQRASPEQLPTPPDSAPSHQISIVSFILAPSLRGNNQLQELLIPEKTDQVAIQLELEADDYKNYQVALQNQSNNRIIWQSGKVKSKTKGANKFLNLSFPAKLLQSQVYSLEVSGISADGAKEIISDYSFRAVLK